MLEKEHCHREFLTYHTVVWYEISRLDKFNNFKPALPINNFDLIIRQAINSHMIDEAAGK